MTDVPYVSQDNFKAEVLDSTLPVMVDFTAVWCGPCKAIDPIIEQLHIEWQGKIKVVKCDADQNTELLTSFGIMGIPTVMMFKNGTIAERVSGYLPKEKLVAKLLPNN